MNRRSFFGALSALAVSPVVPVRAAASPAARSSFDALQKAFRGIYRGSWQTGRAWYRWGSVR
jgi:hypothetical protein